MLGNLFFGPYYACNYRFCRRSSSGTVVVVDLANGGNHPIQIVIGEVRSGGEAEAAVEEVGGNIAADDLGSVENWLEVHGFPDGARFDVMFLEGEAELFAIAAKQLRVDCQAGQPAG